MEISSAIPLEVFIKGAKAIRLKIPERSNAKVCITQNDKPLFWFTRYENLPIVLKELLKGGDAPQQTAPAASESSPAPKPALSVPSKLDGKALTQAQMSLLKVREKFDFFKDMSNEEVLAVTHSVVMLKLAKGEMIFEQGDAGVEAYFIIQGGVDISISAEQGSGTLQKYAQRMHLVTLPPETIFGEMAPISGEPRSARAVAGLQGATLLSFKVVEGIAEGKERACAILYKNFTKILSKKLYSTNQMLLQKEM